MRIRTAFKGGYKFKRYEGQPSPVLVEDNLPKRVIIPMRQGFGTEVKPLVKKGDTVLAGQIIGRDDVSVSSPIHASINGVVEDIKKLNYFNNTPYRRFPRVVEDSRIFGRMGKTYDCRDREVSLSFGGELAGPGRYPDAF
jgi:Na+-translocating ferredoxin:NAD+ oxidoreductase RnfC subunit